MPETKTIVVLANSVRNKPNACVAGREVFEKKGGRKYGKWIRPVSKTSQGEVTLAQRSLNNGKEVSVLDIVEIQLAKPQGDELQPENWILEGEKNWKLIGKATAEDLAQLVETPPSIWMEKGVSDDRVTTGYLKKAGHSLLLIRVDEVTLMCWLDNFHGNPWRRRRILFKYNGLDYDIAFTDPAIEARFGVKFPSMDKKPFEKKIAGPCYLCLSLAHETKNGKHFKLLAGLIDPSMF